MKCYARGDKRLALAGLFATLVELLREPTDIASIYGRLQHAFALQLEPRHRAVAMQHHMQALEVLLDDGWVVGTLDPQRPKLTMRTPEEGRMIHTHRDTPADAVHPGRH